LIQNRGHIEQSEVDRFLDAGFTQAQFIEVILGIALKTFSNYVSIALNIPLDAEFEKYAWQPNIEPRDAA
jgi:alkylhydroperoxidase family enzyme